MQSQQPPSVIKSPETGDPMPRPAHVMIATPCYGGTLTDQFVHSFLALRAHLAANAHWVTVELKTLPSESLIPRGRDALVALFLSHQPFTHILFIDADLQFPPDALLRMLAINEPITAAPYAKKCIDYDVLRERVLERANTAGAEVPDADEMSSWGISFVVNFYTGPSAASGRPLAAPLPGPGPEGDEEAAKLVGKYLLVENQTKIQQHPADRGFVAVQEAGTGFLMIRRDAFTMLREAYPDKRFINDVLGYDQMHPHMRRNYWMFFQCFKCPYSHRVLSEDYAFCRLWTDIGGVVWMDSRPRIGHVGRHTFGSDLLTSGVLQLVP